MYLHAAACWWILLARMHAYNKAILCWHCTCVYLIIKTFSVKVNENLLCGPRVVCIHTHEILNSIPFLFISVLVMGLLFLQRIQRRLHGVCYTLYNVQISGTHISRTVWFGGDFISWNIILGENLVNNCDIKRVTDYVITRLISVFFPAPMAWY